MTLAGTAGLLGLYRGSAAAEPPPEMTRIRLEWAGGTCQAPKYVAEELLRAERFADVQYVHREANAPAAASGREDRARGSQQHDGPALVAILLLYGGRQP